MAISTTTTRQKIQRYLQTFDAERVTRRIYDRFKLEHAAFLQFIEGITAQGDREWYASLMLNRLMFIYFIQRKGFLDTKSPQALDGDSNYLANRLQSVRQMQQGQQQENKLQTFYRYFLLKLFHDGLSKRENARSPELQALLGNIPYLDGGLFDLHTLESAYPHIDIPDQAFERLFAFFNEFEWHLDNRPLRNDREINPDVLGYIFEKYINQKQRGTYYTREDITGYISQNTIIPFIFDATEQKDLVAFQPDGSIWSLLREDPDKYIYDAVKKGCDKPLPPEIEAGVHGVARRGEWDKAAPEEYALPTEIWREVVARRARYEEVRAKLASGEVTSINDLITYNLDICKFAGDVITYCEGPDLLLAFYHAIESVTVLDPTCGSGAFLFAALNILEPLYEACLDHMQNLVDERDQLDAGIPVGKRRHYPAIEQFRAILREVEKHPSHKYFIYKSIIINNLYGVDIMEEATEICKLRLFLKLVSQVDKYNDIGSLPDIDFNIRAGNTLVGFASYEETKKALQGKTVGKGMVRESSAYQDQMIFDDCMNRIEQKAQEIERAFKDFRKIQTEIGQNPEDMAANKQQIRKMLKELGTELDGYLASEYGIDRNNIIQKDVYDQKFKQWQESHRPFHWWIEFYGIMKKGGFDVITGNPPYVEYEKVIEAYRVRNYRTLEAGNLYALALERGQDLLVNNGRFGMIVPASATCTDGYLSLQEILLQQSPLHISSFSDQRGKLFDIPHPRLCIILYPRQSGARRVFGTSYIKPGKELRDKLFQRLEYIEVTNQVKPGVIPRYGTFIEQRLSTKLFSQTHTLGDYVSKSGNSKVYYTRKLSWFVQITPFIPQILDANGALRNPSELKILFFTSPANADIAFVTLNSNLFYWFLTSGSDCRNLNMREVLGLPINIDTMTIATQVELRKLAKMLAEHLQSCSEYRKMHFKGIGSLTIQCMFPIKSKPIIDEIDRVLAQHYGFTDEELDFIINYDIKYRMGRDNGDEGEE